MVLNIPNIATKLSCNIDIPIQVQNSGIEGKIIDLRDSLGQKIRAWKKISNTKVVCIGKEEGTEVQYTLELENITGNNSIASAINSWMYAKVESTGSKYHGKDVKYYEKVYFNAPRLYEIRINNNVFKLNLRKAKLTEMGRDLLLQKKKATKRKGKILTFFREKGYIKILQDFDYEKTLKSNSEVAETLVEHIADICCEVEISPPEPIEGSFFFRIHELECIGDHLIKLTQQRAKGNDDILSLDRLYDYLEDNFDEIVTEQEITEILAKMKRKIRKIARQYWRKKITF